VWRRLRRRPSGRQTLGRSDVIGHPGVSEFNRHHHDAPLSARGRAIWWTILGLIVLGFVALILLRLKYGVTGTSD
jgi:hypothetical protein